MSSLAVKMQFSSETKCQLYYNIKTSIFFPMRFHFIMHIIGETRIFRAALKEHLQLVADVSDDVFLRQPIVKTKEFCLQHVS